MFIFVYLPTGVKHVTSMQGRFLRLVDCKHCQEAYAFQLDLQSTGEVYGAGDEASAAQARRKAEENLLAKSKNVVLPIPCPKCGCYQKDMVEKMKEDASINSAQIIGLVIVLLAFLPLAISRSAVSISLTVVLALIGIGPLVSGILKAFRFDPNVGDPEPRKALGRSKAVWGKELEELRAKAEDQADRHRGALEN